MYAKILSLEPVAYPPLVPAPSVADAEWIAEERAKAPRTNKDIMDGPHYMVTSYRGSLVYLDNGDSMYRLETNAPGGNGLLSDPVGEEGCLVNARGKWWRARVEYTPGSPRLLDIKYLVMIKGDVADTPMGVFSTRVAAREFVRSVGDARPMWIEKFVVDQPGFYEDEDEYIVWKSVS